MPMIEIEYCRDGVAVSDFEAAGWADYVVRRAGPCGHCLRHRVSTSLPVHMVRLAIVTGKLRAEDVAFVFEGKVFSANEYGAIPEWPRGFAELGGDVMEGILRAALDKRKGRRAARGG